MRFYEPGIARFIARDMADQAVAMGKLNRYEYALSDPLNAVDPTGQDWVKLVVRWVICRCDEQVTYSNVAQRDIYYQREKAYSGGNVGKEELLGPLNFHEYPLAKTGKAVGGTVDIGGHHVPLEKILQTATHEGSMVGKNWTSKAAQMERDLVRQAQFGTAAPQSWGAMAERMRTNQDLLPAGGKPTPLTVLRGHWRERKTEWAKGLYSSQAWSLFGAIAGLGAGAVAKALGGAAGKVAGEAAGKALGAGAELFVQGVSVAKTAVGEALKIEMQWSKMDTFLKENMPFLKSRKTDLCKQLEKDNKGWVCFEYHGHTIIIDT